MDARLKSQVVEGVLSCERCQASAKLLREHVAQKPAEVLAWIKENALEWAQEAAQSLGVPFDGASFDPDAEAAELFSALKERLA